MVHALTSDMRTMWMVTNANGQTYLGMSTLLGRAMWINAGDDPSLLSSEGLKFKRDGRWLAQALKSDPSAKWTEV